MILNVISGGNYVLTAIGCFVLGYMISKRRKPQPTGTIASKTAQPKISRDFAGRRAVVTAPMQSTARCGTCGAITKPGKRFCTSCGSAIAVTIPSPPPRQSQITGRCGRCGSVVKPGKRFCITCGSPISRTRPSPPVPLKNTYSPEFIKARLEKIATEDEATFGRLIQDLELVDDWGGYWALGAQSSKWYLNVNGEWIRDQPMSNLRIRGRNGAILDNHFLSDTQAQTPTTGKKPRNVCPYCNRQVSELQVFCMECGHRLPKPN
jgi:rRNA maturation endonuclease Nob1